MRRALAATATVLALLAAGCSSDEPTATPDESATPSESAEPAVTLDDLNPDTSLTIEPADLDPPEGVAREAVDVLAGPIEEFLAKSIDADAVRDMPDGDVAAWTLTSLNTATRDSIIDVIVRDVEPGPVGFVFADRFAAGDEPTESRILRAQWTTRTADDGLLFVGGTVWSGHQFDDGVVLVRHHLELSAYPEDLPYEDAWEHGWNLAYGFHGAEPCRAYVDGVYTVGDQRGIEEGLAELRDFLTAEGEQPQGFSEDGETVRDPSTEREACLADGYEPAADGDSA